MQQDIHYYALFPVSVSLMHEKIVCYHSSFHGKLCRLGIHMAYGYPICRVYHAWNGVSMEVNHNHLLIAKYNNYIELWLTSMATPFQAWRLGALGACS